MSRRTEEILERYRASQSLDEASRARLLGAIQKRIASGAGIPKPGEAHGHAAGRSLAKTLSIVPKIVLGFALVGAPAAWLARGTLTRGAPRTVASIPAGARTNLSQGARPYLDPAPASAWMPSIPAGAGTNSSQGALPPAYAPSMGERSADALVAQRPSQGSHAPLPSPAPADRPTPAFASASTPTLTPASALAPAPAPTLALAPTVAASPGAPPAASHPASEVDEEVRLVGLAYSLLRDGAPARALAVLEAHERRFPDGKLAELRKVTRVLALCQSGRTADARSERDRFLSFYPRSPYSNRVRSACSDAGSP